MHTRVIAENVGILYMVYDVGVYAEVRSTTFTEILHTPMFTILA